MSDSLYTSKEDQTISAEVKTFPEGNIQLLFSSDCGKFGADEILDEFEMPASKLLEILRTDEDTLTIPDIRNKLSPITHLISLVERNESDFIEKVISQAKESVNYLSQREVYSR